MAVKDFIKKEETKKLLSKINNAFNDHQDAEDINLHSRMKKKQIKNLERDPW